MRYPVAARIPSKSTSFEYGLEADGTLAFVLHGTWGAASETSTSAANATCRRTDFFVMSTWAYG